MSSMVNSQGVVFATAMAVSGTVILIALRLQKSFLATDFPADRASQSSPPILRSCISSDEKKRQQQKKKKKKRVHFAEDVRDSSGNGKELRRQLTKTKTENRGMPANRIALYNGILRDRVAQRLAYSY